MIQYTETEQKKQPPIYPLWYFLESDKKLHPARIVNGRYRISLDNGRDTAESLYKKLEQAKIIIEKLKYLTEWTPFLQELEKIIGDNKAYWLVTAYYFRFDSFKDIESGYKILSYELCGFMEGASEEDIVGKNYKAKNLIENFSRDVAPIELERESNEEYNIHKGKARRIVKIHFPEHIMNLYEEAKTKRQNKLDKSYWLTRKPFSPRNTNRRIEEVRTVVLKKYTSDINIEKELMYYMNMLPKHYFYNPIDKNYSSALKAIADSNKSDKHKSNQTTLLNDVQDLYMQFYQSEGSTPRLFSAPEGTAIQNLSSYIRKKLFPEWIDIDLKNCHFAVAASLWDMKGISKLLEKGVSIWPILMADLNVSEKEIIKVPVNSLVYGAGKKKIRETINDDRLYRSFMKHPIIKELLDMRDVKIKEIKKQGGMTDAFGKFISVANVRKNLMKKKDEEKIHAELTVLSYVLQSFEMALLEPVIRKAIECKDKKYGYTMTLWMHDGCSIELKRDDSEENKRILNYLKNAVEAKAAEFGIKTTLEVTL